MFPMIFQWQGTQELQLTKPQSVSVLKFPHANNLLLHHPKPNLPLQLSTRFYSQINPHLTKVGSQIHLSSRRSYQNLNKV